VSANPSHNEAILVLASAFKLSVHNWDVQVLELEHKDTVPATKDKGEFINFKRLLKLPELLM
jgi:hypothetical protein